MVDISIGGAGWAGTVHALAAAATGRVRVRAVASRDPEHAGNVASVVNADVLTFAELPVGKELVIVATPPVHHHELARKAIDAGNPVLIEKPLCSTLEEADDLIAAVTAAGTVAGYAENLLFAPIIELARARILALGPLRHLELRCAQPPPDWGHFIEPLTDGGVLHDLGAHPLALALAFTSPVEPVSVTATLSSTRLDDADDLAEVTLTFPPAAGAGNGSTAALTAHIECSWLATEPSWTIQAASDTGTVVVELLPQLRLEHNGVEVELPPLRDDLADLRLEEFGYINQLNGILDVTLGRGGNLCPLGFAREVLSVTSAAYASAGADGEPVALPWTGRRDLTPLQLWRGVDDAD